MYDFQKTEVYVLTRIHCNRNRLLSGDLTVCTVGPLIIESLWAKKWVSTGALEALDDTIVVQMKIWKTDWVPVDDT